MTEENISQDFRLKNISLNCFIKEIEQNELKVKKEKKGLFGSKLY